MTVKQKRDDAEARRRHILDEAIRIIGQRGYHGFTVQQVAQACGLTNGGLLYHFGSKEQLLVAVLEERDRRYARIVSADVDLCAEEAEGTGIYARAAVLQLLRAIMARSVAEPEIMRLFTVLQSEALDAEHPAHAYFRRREAMVLDEFAAMLTGHAPDPRATARQVLALLDGLAQQWLRADGGFDLLAEWDAVMTLLLSPSDTAPAANTIET